MTQGAENLGDQHLLTLLSHRLHTLHQALGHSLNSIAHGQPLGQVLLRGPTNLAVDDTVLGQGLNMLLSHPAQGLGSLHEGHGVTKGLQVGVQGAGVSSLLEPGRQLLRLRCRQLVADFLGQLQHGFGAQATVQVVMQANLRQLGNQGQEEGLNVHVFSFRWLRRSRRPGPRSCGRESGPRYGGTCAAPQHTAGRAGAGGSGRKLPRPGSRRRPPQGCRG